MRGRSVSAKSTCWTAGLALLVTALLMTTTLVFQPVHAQQPYPHHAGIVIRFGDGHVRTACVDLGDDGQATGEEVLRAAGVSVVMEYSGMGGIVCKIDGEGCNFPDQPCFCQCTLNPGEPCVYWIYYYLEGGNWQYSGMGATGHTVHSGEVEGWAWGEGTMAGGEVKPPVMSFDQICVPPATPTNTPIPPTDTPVPPTDTPEPEPTATSPPPEPTAWFRLDDNPIAAGACTMIRWDTSDAQEVYLDGERVDRNGSRQVCPVASQEYRLRVVGEAEERTETLILGVTGTAPSPTSTAQQPTVIPSPLPSPISQQSAAATSAPSSPTSQAEEAPSPSLSPIPLEPTMVLQSPTPTRLRVALLAPSPTPTSAAEPVSQPSQPAEAAEATDNGRGPSATQLGYITFNTIMIGLLSWLIVRMIHRR